VSYWTLNKGKVPRMRVEVDSIRAIFSLSLVQGDWSGHSSPMVICSESRTLDAAAWDRIMARGAS
jgi:hypothetical protein